MQLMILSTLTLLILQLICNFGQGNRFSRHWGLNTVHRLKERSYGDKTDPKVGPKDSGGNSILPILITTK